MGKIEGEWLLGKVMGKWWETLGEMGVNLREKWGKIEGKR